MSRDQKEPANRSHDRRWGNMKTGLSRFIDLQTWAAVINTAALLSSRAFLHRRFTGTFGTISLGTISLGTISLGAISLRAISLGAISLRAVTLASYSRSIHGTISL